jgi:hypothetical protein
MGYSASGTAGSEAGPARQPPPPGTVRLADMLTLSCRISQTGQATVTFAGELDIASADQACQYVGTLSTRTAEGSCWTWPA